jgi:hypothetical protein
MDHAPLKSAVLKRRLQRCIRRRVRSSGDLPVLMRGGRGCYRSRKVESGKRELREGEIGERSDGARLRDRARHRGHVHDEQREQTEDDDALAERRSPQRQQTQWIGWSYCPSNSV